MRRTWSPRHAAHRATSTALRYVDVALCRSLAHRMTAPQHRPLNLEDCQTWEQVNQRMRDAGFGVGPGRKTEARRILNAARKALR